MRRAFEVPILGASGVTMEFGIGRVLATAIRVWIRNLLPFTVITAVLCSPVLIWGISVVQGDADYAHYENVVAFERYSRLALLFLNLLVSAAVTYGVVMELQGMRASSVTCITIGLTRSLSVLGVGVLTMLCIMGATFALIVPGLLVMCMLYVSTTVAVIERPGVTAALARSRELTKGHRLQIFALYVLLFGLGWGAVKLVVMLTLPNGNDPNHAAETLARMPLYMYVSLAREVLLTSFSSVVVGVAYFLLRSEKEGTSAAELAAVFD